ncbi:MAG: hypothetical protein CMK89_21395 [Pseudomonadales bacterium]|nr:hypothetical protein [Pseudomonadales bacterium]
MGRAKRQEPSCLLPGIMTDMYKLFRDSKYTYKTLAAKSGVSQHTLYKWFFRGVGNASIGNIEAVADVLGYELQLVRVVK